MTVSAIGRTHEPHQQKYQSINEQRSASRASNLRQSQKHESQALVSGDTDVKEIPDGEKVPGVIRKLEANHFKGVADVRLRINFFEELSSRATSAAIPVVQDEVQSLVGVIEGGVQSLIDSLGLDTETSEAVSTLFADFSDEIDVTVNTLIEEGHIDSNSVSQAVQSVFTSLLEKVSELLTPPVEDQSQPQDTDTQIAPVDEQLATAIQALSADTSDTVSPIDTSPATDEPTEVDQPAGNEVNTTPTTPTVEDEETALSTEDALTSLQTLFDEAIASLLTSLSTTTQVSDLSEPSGNGSAYDKFLAIYNNLRGVAPAIDEHV